jgi:hypothetical protein
VIRFYFFSILKSQVDQPHKTSLIIKIKTPPLARQRGYAKIRALTGLGGRAHLIPG